MVAWAWTQARTQGRTAQLCSTRRYGQPHCASLKPGVLQGDQKAVEQPYHSRPARQSLGKALWNHSALRRIFKLIPTAPLLPSHPPISPAVTTDLDVPYRLSIQHTFCTVSGSGRSLHKMFRIAMREYRKINTHQTLLYEHLVWATCPYLRATPNVIS